MPSNTATLPVDGTRLAARLLLGLMFVVSGYLKIGGYARTQAYMDAAGVPGVLLPLVIVTELLGGLMVMIGWKTRQVALVLAAFTLLATLLFHLKPGELNALLKNLAVIGGFLALVAAGPGRWSVDQE